MSDSGIVPNLTLERVRAQKTALGFGLYHLRTAAGPGIARATGHHWVFIDAEHGALSMSEVAELCMVSLASGVTPIVRFSQDALDHAARALDNGAQGVLVAMVENADQARQIVAALRHAPLGRRGWGGAGTRFGYRPPRPDVAMEAVNADTMVMAMIETRAGVDRASEIASVPGIDGLFVGLSDLSIALGVPGRFDDPSIQDAFADVARACAANAKFLGMGGVYDEVLTPRFLAMGARLVATGNDHSFLMSAAAARVLFLNSQIEKSG